MTKDDGRNTKMVTLPCVEGQFQFAFGKWITDDDYVVVVQKYGINVIKNSKVIVIGNHDGNLSQHHLNLSSAANQTML